MNCGPQSFVPVVWINGQPRPMPPGGVLVSQYLQVPAWAYRVKSTSIADSTEFGRQLITTLNQQHARSLLGITQASGAPVEVNAAGNLVRTDTNVEVLDLPKTREFVNTDYDALVRTMLGQ